MIWDTTFAIDLMNKDEKAIQKLKEIVSMGETQKTTVITIHELSRGIARSNKPEIEKNKMKELLKDQFVVEFDEKSAERSGELEGALIKEGNRIDAIDCMIAGIALTRNEKLITRNQKDFGKIQGLELVTY